MSPPPTLTLNTTSAHLLSLLFSLTYVGSLYISKHSRLSFSSSATTTTNKGDRARAREKEHSERWRDDPDVIRARLFAVCLATTLCCTIFGGVVWCGLGFSWGELPSALSQTLLLLGFSLPISSGEILPHLITPTLFLGPLFSGYLGGQLPFQRNWVWENHVTRRFCTLVGVRNYVVAPITEEIVFRACILSIYHLSGASTLKMIFLAPLAFGLAHVHHAWDTYNRYGRTPSAAKRALFTSLFQLTYTSLFGFHTSFLFLRTGSILPPISAHIFCNVMGVPDLGWELGVFRNRRGAIISAYVAGVVGFVLQR
ncbi:uncharacterized protein LACBIDRAFT_332961 [Laccaria bicolor S238N-H82]|uniref:intramembrane prenyl-peptidase Rce1 n=1 Tax=Laccaria bicolor (strain S238N-H82 / ATCC MYA-4686) TaxID=486041 RepID=B0DUE7_LACBS|nr:uncharacterized protein LACBIDRAFT_332961 [Laccaria bicolor S238N-H82]EDR01791.1 predicted protein [Laccaria bicolor S238N-H82]|eukprot:XP_001887604.1 predicted protein [Laccaria bicolor S238N-H82]